MNADVTQWDRNFRRGLLGTALVFGVLDYWLAGEQLVFRAGFVITVAGLVGYFTNFLAIKMLFQPKQGRVLGWQGLVPKNKDQIARSLAESVQEQLLSPDIILAYIRERQLIEVGTQAMADWVDNNLQDPDVRNRITSTLVDLMRESGPDLLTNSLDYAEEALKALARNPRTIDLWWQDVRAVMQDFLQSPANRAWLAKRTSALLNQEIPRVADWINRAIDDYLREKHRLGRLGLGLKNIFSFDEAAIAGLLERFASDSEVSEDFMALLDAIVDELQREMTAPEVQAVIQDRLADWIERVGKTFRGTILPGIIDQTDSYLKDENNWEQIEESLIRLIVWLKQQTLGLLNSSTGQAWVSRIIESAVHQLNVTNLVEEQVKRLDTDELEKMVLDNTGGNLTIIQVLGGCLGLIAGTVQVHIAFAVPIAGLLAIVWVAWRINERRGNAASQRP